MTLLGYLLGALRSKSRVVSPLDRSPDAEYILEGDEFDLEWTEESQPLDWFLVNNGKSLEQYAASLGKQNEERIASVEQWAQLRGGIAKAIFESPILAFEDGTVLDGTHRLLAARRASLPLVTVLIGHRNTSR